jgi:hypothetical protein
MRRLVFIDDDSTSRTSSPMEMSSTVAAAVAFIAAIPAAL